VKTKTVGWSSSRFLIYGARSPYQTVHMVLSLPILPNSDPSFAARAVSFANIRETVIILTIRKFDFSFIVIPPISLF